MTTTKRDLERQAAELAAHEVCVETNSGTYGADEACRAIGTGDPAFANYYIYESVGSKSRRVVGCDPKEAPGYARTVGRAELARKRNELQQLRQAIRAAR